VTAASFLPYGRQDIDDDDIAAVAEVLRSDWLTTGPAVAALEKAFAAAMGARYAVACSSGTAGLHLANLALGLGPGDSVAVPSNTFVATANAARYVGASVRLCDVDPDSGLMRPTDLEEALARPGPPVKAVAPVHFGGHTADLEALAEIAARHGAVLVEDACHAVGTTYRTRIGEQIPVGACRHSAMAVFSLHPVKTITMGEGGIVTTQDEGLYRRLLQWRTHGISRDPKAFRNKDLAFDENGNANPWYYEAQDLGFNYRASDINCALGLSQLAKLPRFAERRRDLAAEYDRLLAPLAPILRPLAKTDGCDPVLHLYVVLIDFAALGLSRSALMTRLQAEGIGTQVHYIPVHKQPLYHNEQNSLPGAERYYAQCLSLPLFAGMATADVERVVAVLTGLIRS